MQQTDLIHCYQYSFLDDEQRNVHQNAQFSSLCPLFSHGTLQKPQFYTLCHDGELLFPTPCFPSLYTTNVWIHAFSFSPISIHSSQSQESPSLLFSKYLSIQCMFCCIYQILTLTEQFQLSAIQGQQNRTLKIQLATEKGEDNHSRRQIIKETCKF